MLNWEESVNAVEIIANGLVQAAVVVLTALLTWIITSRSERRKARDAAEATYRRQIQAYAEDFHELSGMLDDVAAEQAPMSREQIRTFERFVNRTSWVPRPEDLAVDSWAKSSMTRMVHQITQHTSDDSWDEAVVHDVRAGLFRISTEFDSWMGGLTPTSHFWESLEESGMRVYNARFGDPLAQPRSRAKRLRHAIGDAWRGIVSAWKGNPL